jgi:hypothetical protein
MDINVIRFLAHFTLWEAMMTHPDSSKQQGTEEKSGFPKPLLFLLLMITLGLLTVVLKIIGIL